jgi:hypothetical protein
MTRPLSVDLPFSAAASSTRCTVQYNTNQLLGTHGPAALNAFIRNHSHISPQTYQHTRNPQLTQSTPQKCGVSKSRCRILRCKYPSRCTLWVCVPAQLASQFLAPGTLWGLNKQPAHDINSTTCAMRKGCCWKRKQECVV